MAKKLIVKQSSPMEEIPTIDTVIINPINQEFGNGDLNILRDKINEIIRSK